MEGDKTLKESYDTVIKTIKNNTTGGTLVIDYSKLDEKTASMLRLNISRVLGQRKRELWQALTGVK